MAVNAEIPESLKRDANDITQEDVSEVKDVIWRILDELWIILSPLNAGKPVEEARSFLDRIPSKELEGKDLGNLYDFLLKIATEADRLLTSSRGFTSDPDFHSDPEGYIRQVISRNYVFLDQAVSR